MVEFFDTSPAWVLPVVIFFGRICDVSLGTLRIVFVAKGEKKIAPLIGFVEVFIWVVIIAQVLSRASDFFSYFAYAGGYAAGTYIGLLVEEKIGFGFIKFRVFTQESGAKLAGILHRRGYGATVIRGEGVLSEIDVVEAVVSRKKTKTVKEIITDYDPKVFYLIEDIRAKEEGIFIKDQSLLGGK